MLLSKLIDLLKKGDSNFINAEVFEDFNIKSAASLDIASNNEISFLEDNNQIKDSLPTTRASVLIISNNEKTINLIHSSKISSIVVENPRIAFAEVLKHLYKNKNISIGIDRSATINKTSKIGKNCYVGPNVFVGEETIIGDNNILLPGTIIL